MCLCLPEISVCSIFLVFIILVVFLFVVLIISINVEQIVLPRFARLATVLSGVTAGFLRKSDFVVVEAEGDGGMPVIKRQRLWETKNYSKTYTASPTSAWSKRP